MNCEQFRTQLNERLDARQDPVADEALSVHAGQCPRCQRLWKGQRQLARLDQQGQLARLDQQGQLARLDQQALPAAGSGTRTCPPLRAERLRAAAPLTALLVLIILQGANLGIAPRGPAGRSDRDGVDARRLDQATRRSGSDISDPPALAASAAPASASAAPISAAPISAAPATMPAADTPVDLRLPWQRVLATQIPLPAIARLRLQPDAAWNEFCEVLAAQVPEPSGWVHEMQHRIGPFQRTMGRTWHVLRRNFPPRPAAPRDAAETTIRFTQPQPLWSVS